MVHCKVDFLGLRGDLADLESVEVDLNQGADLGDLIAELKRKIPALEGIAFVSGENKLMGHYVFAINGRFHMNDSGIHIQNSDHILLLILVGGG